jgi:hypothetical protein
MAGEPQQVTLPDVFSGVKFSLLHLENNTEFSVFEGRYCVQYLHQRQMN